MKKDWNEIVDNMKKKLQADYKKCLLGKVPLYDNFLDYFEKHAVPIMIVMVKEFGSKGVRIAFLNGMISYLLGLEQKIISVKEAKCLVDTKMNIGLKKDKFINWVKIYSREDKIITVTAKEDGQYIFYWDFVNKKWLLIGKSINEELDDMELSTIVELIKKYENHEYLPLCNFWEEAKRKIRRTKNDKEDK